MAATNEELQLHACWIGNARAGEFSPALALLEQHAVVRRAETTAAAIAALQGTELDPALIVLAQSWPGEYKPNEVERLQQSAPLARLVLLWGSWSDGELRTGYPVPGVWRVSWLRFAAWLDQSLAQWRAGQVPDWSLPLTMTEDERLAAAASFQGNASAAARQVLLQTTDHDRQDWLQRALVGSGWQVATTVETGHDLAAALLDVDGFDEAARADARRLVQGVAPAPVLVLMSFPRLEDLEMARHLGCRAVIAKPLVWSELLWQLERCHAPSNQF